MPCPAPGTISLMPPKPRILAGERPHSAHSDGLIIDWHSHSYFSDGRATHEAMIAQASRHGVVLGLSDHILMDNPRLQSVEELTGYMTALSALPVVVGAEVSVGDVSDEAQVAIASGVLDEFDYLIASLHQVDLPQGRVTAAAYLNWRFGMYPRYVPTVVQYDRRDYFDEWLRMLAITLKTMPVRILGHFALFPEQADATGTSLAAIDPTADPEPDSLAREWLDATIDLCLRHDVAIELNSKSRVPHRQFIERAAERGARFSLGSDAHHLERAGDIGFGRAILHELGIGNERVLSGTDLDA